MKKATRFSIIVKYLEENGLNGFTNKRGDCICAIDKTQKGWEYANFLGPNCFSGLEECTACVVEVDEKEGFIVKKQTHKE